MPSKTTVRLNIDTTGASTAIEPDKRRHVYIDESHNPKLRRHGTIVLVAVEQIGPETIRRAAKTVYGEDAPFMVFHANESSDDERRALLGAAQLVNCKGAIDSVASESQLVDKKSVEATNRFLAFIGLLPVWTSPHPTTLWIHRRSTFSQQAAEQWFEDQKRRFEAELFRTITIPHYSPDVTIHVVDDAEPGIQLADMLLWAHMREKASPAGTSWFSDNARITQESETEPEKHSNVEFELGRPFDFRDPLLKAPRANPDLESLTPLQFDSIVTLPERFVQSLAGDGTSARAAHLQAEVNDLSRLLKRKARIEKDSLERLARLMLRLLHQQPLYEDRPDEEVLVIYQMANYCSRILNHAYGHHTRMRLHYLRNRPGWFDKNPAVLGLENEEG